MRTIKSISLMERFVSDLQSNGKKIGLVPTMGYLHEGHLSLIRRARKECDQVIVSIFVNPTQFGPKEDLKRYPRDLTRDMKLLEKEGVDVLFHPTAAGMYPEGYATYIYVDGLSDRMCGASRPGHFRGVATVVAKLFNLIKPDIAYFGKKDFQQLVIIKRMIKDLNIPVKISGLPIIRERDGLAMSSRNKYLGQKERVNATVLFKSLNKAKWLIKRGVKTTSVIKKEMSKMISAGGLKTDYIAIVDPETLEEKKSASGRTLVAIAAFAGKTRLIDNIEIGGTA